MLLNDKKVYVGHYTSKKERPAQIEEQKAQFTNVYVKNTNLEAMDDGFSELIRRYDEVTSPVIQRDEEGKSKGFGFVNFKDHGCAEAGVDALHSFEGS